jgi:glutathione S-transferase
MGGARMADVTLWGFDGSTYVRTVKMLMAEKGFTDYEQVQVNVLAGEPKQEEHLGRHPFGKVPVLDYEGFRILETSAITRYLNEKLPGNSLIPAWAEERARMDMIMGLVDSYGYGALIGGVAAYHLFPDFVGGQNDEARQAGIETGRKLLDFAMKTRGDKPFIAGELSLADLYLAPILFYVSLTPDKDVVFDIPGLPNWWSRVGTLDSYRKTEPNLG